MTTTNKDELQNSPENPSPLTAQASNKWTFLRWAIFLSLLGFFVYYPVRHREIISQILSLSLLDFAALSLLYVGNVYLTAVSLFCLARPKVPTITLTSWCGLHWVALFLNLLPFKAGMLVRAAYLKKIYGFGYLDLAAVLVGHLLLAFGIAGVLGWIALMGQPIAPGYFPLLAVGFSAMMVLPWLGWWFPHSFFDSLERKLSFLAKWLKKPWRAWLSFRSDRGALLIASPFIGATFFAIAWRLVLIYNSFGVPLSFWGGLLLATAAMVLRKVSIIPGNLGVREGFLTLIAGLMGVEPQIAFLGTLLDRGVMLVWTFLFGGSHSWFLFKTHPELRAWLQGKKAAAATRDYDVVGE